MSDDNQSQPDSHTLHLLKLSDDLLERARDVSTQYDRQMKKCRELLKLSSSAAIIPQMPSDRVQAGDTDADR